MKNVFLLFLAIIIVSCKNGNVKVVFRDSLINNKDTLSEYEFGMSKPEVVSDTSKMQIISINDTLYKGDTLTIHFKVPHYKDLAITKPNGDFMFLVFSAPEQNHPSLVNWDDFENARTIKIITDKTKANPFNFNIKSNQLIFTETGLYNVKLSENLETDDGTPVEIRSVYYINKYRNKSYI